MSLSSSKHLRVVQYRYYGEKNPIQDNFPPVNIDKNQNRTILWPQPFSFEKYKGMQRIIIQTIPGTRIYMNSSKLNNGSNIIIGKTGIFDSANKDNLIKTSSNFSNYLPNYDGFELDESSKQIINSLENGYLIITILYTGEVSTYYKIRILPNILSVYKNADITSGVIGQITKGPIYTIISEDEGFGKLKSNNGWIELAQTEKV